MKMDNETKSIFLSKTLWFNLLSIVLLVVNRYDVVIDPAVVEPMVALILPLINMGLRLVTKKPVTLVGK
jgi:hypothetical protein